MWLLLLTVGCNDVPPTETCSCEGDAWGVALCPDDECGACMCLPWLDAEALPDNPAERYLDSGAQGIGTAEDPWGRLDWVELDALLAQGPVIVWVSSRDGDMGESFGEQLLIERTDPGPHRLVIDGETLYRDGDGSWAVEAGRKRARFAGVTTGLDDIKRSYITLRGLELADSSAQGVYWRAGDGVTLERLDVHDNGSSPAMLFDYANRSGLPGSDLLLRSNHVHDVRGECIYVGGAEGTGINAHSGVTVQGNLIHGCGSIGTRVGDKWDGINVKDQNSDVVISGNVVLSANWGVQLESPALVQGNLFADLKSTGIQLSDVWGEGHDGAQLLDNVVARGGEHGVRVGADEADAMDLVIEGLSVFEVKDAGLRLAGDAGLSGSLDRYVVAGAKRAVDGWGSVVLDVGQCAVGEVGEYGRVEDESVLVSCEEAALPDLSNLAGPDGLLLTADDPTVVEGGAVFGEP